jgi:hypothetical protein
MHDEHDLIAAGRAFVAFGQAAAQTFARVLAALGRIFGRLLRGLRRLADAYRRATLDGVLAEIRPFVFRPRRLVGWLLFELN